MGKVNNRKIRLYTEQDLANAITSVQAGMSFGNACRKYNVPKSTIHAKLTGKTSVEKPGPQPTLPPDIELNLVKWIIDSNNRGYSVTKMQLSNSVRTLVRDLEIKNIFGDNGPGRSWYENFLNRHPDVKLLMTQKLNNPRSVISPNSLRSWYTITESYLKKRKLFDIEPERIFSTCEILLLLNPVTETSLAFQNKQIGRNDSKIEDVNVLLTGNAAGQFVPPVMIYPDQQLPSNVIKSLPVGWSFNQSRNGDLTDTNFRDFINNSFYPWLLVNEIRLPVILYIDGDASYLTYPLFKSCTDKQIEIIPLHRNADQFLQPIDVSIDDPLQAAWKSQVDDYRIRKKISTIRIAAAANLLMKVMQEMNLSNMLKHGFHNCGLHPFSADVIGYTKIKSNKKKSTTDESSDSTKTNYSLALKCIEERIDKDTLAAFEAAASSSNLWTGAVEHKSLFYVWNDLKKIMCSYMDSNVIIKEECTVNEVYIKEEQIFDESDNNEEYSFEGHDIRSKEKL